MDKELFTFSKNVILYHDKPLLYAAAHIDKELVLEDSILVLLNTDSLKSDRNIFCYDFKGDLKWQIPEPDKLQANNYYTSIYLTGEGILMAYNINGVEVTIDKQTGAILDKQLIK